ncbi:unnamed protein product [Microthlaspi erraticum]|uniref:Acetyltransferase n=1 Tax=Microthlaspi erraticum TaxID=1685480 RepID=A0A6D2HXW2_9BRAS|nr:unnamed protein product [Microthlaspi erraticum]
MAEVNVISSSIIPGNINQSERTKIHLTSSDLNLLQDDYSQRGLLFHKPDPENRFISQLKTSLSSALAIYFPFAGRLVKVDNHKDHTVSFHVDCNNSGAKFVHAIAESVLASDFLQPDGSVPGFLRAFFPMNGVKSIDGILEPLLAMQVTEMKDGVFISFGYNHMVAAGDSICNFLSAWIKIFSNGQRENLYQPLVLRGWFLDGIDSPIHIPVSKIETKTATSEISTEERVFHFTKKNIYDLNTKVNDENGSSDQEVSSLQAVSAHLWRSITRHSGLNREEVARCVVGVDLRQRLDPRLEKECFGNVIYGAIASATVGELQDRGLGWAALQISKMLTNEDYRNVNIPKSGGRLAGNSIVLSGSPWFEVYDSNFGWGRPIAAQPGPGNSISGKLVLYRGVEDGSIDIHATLFSDMLVSLLVDVEFMENVSIT